MKTFMWMRIIFAPMTVIALVVAIVADYYDYQLCSNVFLGIFGSALLTYLNALISYKVLRREAIVSYIGALQSYRCKFSRLCADSRNIDLYRQLEDYFYDMHYNVYLKFQYIWKNKGIAPKLNDSFQKISLVHQDLKYEIAFCSMDEVKYTWDQRSKKIDEAICIVEGINKGLKQFKGSNQNGQAENGNP